MNIKVTLSYDGNTVEHGVAIGTTPQQIAGANYVRQLLGLPSNVTPMVNGAYSTAPVNDNDVITFQSAPSQKAEDPAEGSATVPDKDNPPAPIITTDDEPAAEDALAAAADEDDSDEAEAE